MKFCEKIQNAPLDQKCYLGNGKRYSETDGNLGLPGLEEWTNQKFEILWKIQNGRLEHKCYLGNGER